MLWERLRNTKSMAFEATSASETGWHGEGRGIVRTELHDSHVLLFHESGHWTPAGGPQIAFRNVFRWTLADEAAITLEHLRLGPDNPVHLFELRPSTPSFWTTFTPHQCVQDTYDAVIRITAYSIEMHWTIEGPSKNESIKYVYR